MLPLTFSVKYCFKSVLKVSLWNCYSHIRYSAKTATILGEAYRPADEVSEFKGIIYEEIDAALIIHVDIADFFSDYVFDIISVTKSLILQNSIIDSMDCYFPQEKHKIA